jgi:RHS repeat-associated protein
VGACKRTLGGYPSDWIHRSRVRPRVQDQGHALRASKTTGGTTTKFVYDTAGGMPLILNDGASSYLYGPGGIPFEQITTAGVATYLHTDQLGSIRMITNTSGASAGTASYTAYGTRTTTGTTSPFGYAGQYTDTETGLQWDRARYYDPTTAQFLTVDPLAALTGARYTYTGGNPITGADPTGLIDWGEVFGVAAAVGTVACVILEPCGGLEGGVALAVAGGESAIALTVSAEAATAATDAAIASGGIAGALDFMMQNTNDGNNGSDCPPKLGAKPNFTNPAESPGPGWEWRGTGDPGSANGSWYNPNSGESLHPDLGHPDPIGPHYDWKGPDGTTYRVYPDGTVVPK